MDFNKVTELLDDLAKLTDDCFKIIDNLNDEYDSDINDWCKMSRMNEKLRCLRTKMFIVTDLYILSRDMENEKDRFEVQKMAQYHEEKLDEELESLIEIGRVWKLRDYRCIDWAKRLVELSTRIKDFFEI